MKESTKWTLLVIAIIVMGIITVYLKKRKELKGEKKSRSDSPIDSILTANKSTMAAGKNIIKGNFGTNKAAVYKMYELNDGKFELSDREWESLNEDILIGTRAVEVGSSYMIQSETNPKLWVSVPKKEVIK